MHPNPVYRQTADAQNIAFARERGFGTLVANTDNGLLLSHVPFVLSDDAKTIDLHLVRSNPIARAELPSNVVLSVTGPDGYISPDWYGIEDQVPTWNYVAVHLHGTLEPLPNEALLDVLDRLSAHNENRLWDKAPWTSSKMTPDVLERMMRQILPFRLKIGRIEGTWKLNQNKSDTVRLRAAHNVSDGIGSDIDELADLMRNPPTA